MKANIEAYKYGELRFLRIPIYGSEGECVELDYEKKEDQAIIEAFMDRQKYKSKLEELEGFIKKYLYKNTWLVSDKHKIDLLNSIANENPEIKYIVDSYIIDIKNEQKR